VAVVTRALVVALLCAGATGCSGRAGSSHGSTVLSGAILLFGGPSGNGTSARDPPAGNREPSFLQTSHGSVVERQRVRYRHRFSFRVAPSITSPAPNTFTCRPTAEVSLPICAAA
jgi:hypothetical protein